ncbi:MAG: DNA mismatch repair endonuclease MutL [Lachnospiraceae bacterium]|nr:DNA mismatch repair endonuclease MutL [Lachnospiraceae bacterium]
MNEIRVLDNSTIDKIAAGEVVERPVSIVKELVENSIDAGSTIITVEIKDGGIKMIRVTDNGSGIDRYQVRNAFLSHATSKIHDAGDLNRLSTLGFRGEALSSIAAVSRVEVTTRTETDLEGVHYVIEGGKEETCESVGAPAGTTFIVRDIFYNTLPRLKFLKSASTEGNLIADMCEHIALSMPHISFQFIRDGVTRFSTSGHDDLKEVIYRIYGKETASNLRAIDVIDDELSMRLHGYLGLPVLNRANRASEVFFINHRFVRSPLISHAVEEGYVEYLMQHKFPFCILNLEFDPEVVDVNVHPTKQEVRISNEKAVSDRIVKAVAECLASREMIDDVTHTLKADAADATVKYKLPEIFEQNRITGTDTTEPADREISFTVDFDSDSEDAVTEKDDRALTDQISVAHPVAMISPDAASPKAEEQAQEFEDIVRGYEQQSFADDERILSADTRRKFRIIGQVFKTYWLIEYEDNLMLMDQHAAHEKVNFERFMARMACKKEIPSQMIAPPVIMSLNNSEMNTLTENMDHINEMGFTVDVFGDHEIAIRAVPMDLFDNKPAELVSEIISDLMDMKKSETPDSIRTRIATMACKASVKGNNTMSVEEVEKLLDEMLTLNNPYNCPHGRPTLITMSKTELDKRFHRIV